MVRRSRTPKWAPEPPVPLPTGTVIDVPGRGEFFLRDSGGHAPPVLLLHGWMFSADLNFWRTYGVLEDAGYRVLAVDHRGHGRGLRTHAPFRLSDCADDAAALIAQIDAAPALVVGYSMGGPIGQLMARDHPEVVSGLVLCATSSHWTNARQRLLWRGMAFIRLLLGLAPDTAWRRGLRAAGFPTTNWTTSELTRGSASDLAEAGRELSRYDAREWLPRLDVPVALVVTTKDTSVPPSHQRELARLLGAQAFAVDGGHSAVITCADEFNRVLLRALAHVGDPAKVAAA